MGGVTWFQNFLKISDAQCRPIYTCQTAKMGKVKAAISRYLVFGLTMASQQESNLLTCLF